MKVKKADALKLWNILEAMSQGAHPIKFSYFIAKNKSKLKDEVEILKTLAIPPEKYQEYDTKRASLAKQFADVDEKGQPIIKGNAYSITEKLEGFNKEVDALKNQYEEVIKAFDEQVGQYKEILKEELEFDGHAIKVDDLPQKIEPVLIELFINTGLISD